MNLLQKLKNEKLIAFTVCFLFWLFICLKSGLITSGFQLIDDHRILNQAIFLNGHNVFELLSNMLSSDFEIRFRPFYWVSRAFLSLLFGNNWALWHIQVGISAVFTSFFLYLAGRNLSFKPYLAAIFSFLSMIGVQSRIWAHLCTAETLGMLLIAAAMYILSLKSQSIKTKITFSILLILASLTKESFLIALPAMVFLFNCLESKNTSKPFLLAVKDNLPVNAVLTILCLLELLIIKQFIGVNEISYAGVGRNTFVLSSISGTFVDLLRMSQSISLIKILGVFFLTILIYSLLIKRDKSFKENLLQNFMPVLIFAALLIAPQIILHSQSGWLFHRYLNPAMLGLSVFLVAGLNLVISYINTNFHNTFIRFFSLSSLAFVMTLLVFEQTLVFNYCIEKYAELCRKTTSAINFIKENKGNRLLMVSDPAINTESSASLCLFTNHYANKQINYVYPINKIAVIPGKYGATMDTEYRKTFAEQIRNFEKEGNIANMDIIIFFSALDIEIDKIMSKQDKFIKKNFKDIIIYVKN